MISKDSVSVDRLAGGDLVPRLNDALQKLAENVLDPSTKATAPRKITLTITMKPDDNRDMGSVELGIAVKLAAPKPAKTTVFINQNRDGSVVLSERDTRQADIFDSAEGETPAPSVPKSIAAKKEAATE